MASSQQPQFSPGKVQTLLLPKAHSKIQNAIMQAYVAQGLTELWVACGTKFGKSVGGTSGICAGAWVRKNGLFRWVAPIYSQAKIGFKYAKRILPGEPVVETNLSGPVMTIKERDTVLEFKSALNPEDLEGEGVHGYGLDEAAKMKEQAYHSAKTTTTVTRGPICGFSTPFGKNWFYKRCMYAKEHMEWSLKNGKAPTHVFLTAPSTLNPAVTVEAVEEARQSLPDRLFRQYYLAEFIDDGSVFVGFRDCVFGEELLNLRQNNQRWIHDGAGEMNVVIGADWAKHKDFTVFVAVQWDKDKPKVVGFHRFQNMRYVDAVKELYHFAQEFADVGIIYHDRTGVGEALDDLLSQTSLPFHGVQFSNSSKSSLVNLLMLTFERQGILIPNWPELLGELDAFEVIVSESGMMRYGVQETHDDTVIALALANMACSEYAGTGMEMRTLEDLPKTELTLDKWYNDLIEDGEDDSLHLFGTRNPI